MPITLTGGYPGVGAWGDTGGAIAAVQVGPRCMTAPTTVDSSNVAVSAYPTSVSLNWPEAAQPPDVTAVGITEWYTSRNGDWYGQIGNIAAWADPNVTRKTRTRMRLLRSAFMAFPPPATPGQ